MATYAEVTRAMSSADQYMTSGEFTVTVEPMHRENWVYDSSDKHKTSTKRGRAMDYTAYQSALNWQDAHQGAVHHFMPTVRMLDASDKYVLQQNGDKLCGGDSIRRTGKLPTIQQQIWDGTLINKSTGDIEHEMREAARRANHRRFDRDGYTR